MRHRTSVVRHQMHELHIMLWFPLLLADRKTRLLCQPPDGMQTGCTKAHILLDHHYRPVYNIASLNPMPAQQCTTDSRCASSESKDCNSKLKVEPWSGCRGALSRWLIRIQARIHWSLPRKMHKHNDKQTNGRTEIAIPSTYCMCGCVYIYIYSVCIKYQVSTMALCATGIADENRRRSVKLCHSNNYHY